MKSHFIVDIAINQFRQASSLELHHSASSLSSNASMSIVWGHTNKWHRGYHTQLQL